MLDGRRFDVTGTINWSGENRLLVRIGAHPAVVPDHLPGGGSFAGMPRWPPMIYDNVTLLLCDNPVIESIQVAPRIDSSEVIVQTKVKNHGSERDFELRHRIRTWKEGREIA